MIIFNAKFQSSRKKIHQTLKNSFLAGHFRTPVFNGSSEKPSTPHTTDSFEKRTSKETKSTKRRFSRLFKRCSHVTVDLQQLQTTWRSLRCREGTVLSNPSYRSQPDSAHPGTKKKNISTQTSIHLHRNVKDSSRTSAEEPQVSFHELKNIKRPGSIWWTPD